MQIIVVYFLYHVYTKKAIAHVFSKIKSANCTNIKSISLAILLQSLKITHYKITSFPFYINSDHIIIILLIVKICILPYYILDKNTRFLYYSK